MKHKSAANVEGGQLSSIKVSVSKEAKMMATMDGAEQSSDVVWEGSLPEAVNAFQQIIQKRQIQNDSFSKSLDSEYEAMSSESYKPSKSTLKKMKKNRKERIKHDPSRWNLRAVHFGEGIAVGKTLDDAYSAFLRWAQKPEDRAATPQRFNLSKAERRFEAFADFQEAHFEDHFSKPVSFEEPGVSTVAELMGTKVLNQRVDRGDLVGCVVWVFDFEKLDPQAIAECFDQGHFGPSAMLRWLFALMLESMFDPATQTDGVVIVQGMNCSLREMSRINKLFKPIETSMNQMVYQCMPFRMKNILVTGSSWWMSILIGIMRLFVSKKIMQRFVNTDTKDVHERLGGSGVLPLGYIGGTGQYSFRYSANSKLARNQGDLEENSESHFQSTLP